MDPVEYWRSRAMGATQEYEQILQSQRDEVERLQRRCNDLLHERSMMKAATAADVRSFCLNYQADQQRKKRLTSSSAVEDIPIHTMLQFLHSYSNGLLPAPDNKRKRSRLQTAEEEEAEDNSGSSGGLVPLPFPTATVATPQAGRPYIGVVQQHQRRYQRIRSRQRAISRLEEEEAEVEELTGEQAGGMLGQTSAGTSTAIAPLQQQQQQQQLRYVDPEERRVAKGGDGGGGPVIAASAFGLPPNSLP